MTRTQLRMSFKCENDTCEARSSVLSRNRIRQVYVDERNWLAGPQDKFAAERIC